jgi:hypothetical protein
MLQPPQKVDYLTIHPTRLILTRGYLTSTKSRTYNPYQNFKEKPKNHNNKISYHAKSKMEKAINYLLYLSTDKRLPDTLQGKNYLYKIAFITLTLPSKQIHNDKVIKETCLNQFLIEITKKYNVTNYIWRAERQQNKNIHFHILIDKFIPWSELRDIWNRIINKLGYVDMYRVNMKEYFKTGFKVRKEYIKSWKEENQLKAYNANLKTDYNNPNSTDIHSIKKVKNIYHYITKYVTKDDNNILINGRLWSCNKELSNIKGARTIIGSNLNSEIQLLKRLVPEKIYYDEYYTCISISINLLRNLKFFHICREFDNYIYDKFKSKTETKTIIFDS